MDSKRVIIVGGGVTFFDTAEVYGPHRSEELVGRDRVVRNMQPSMGAEDFAFMLEKVPGCYLLIGNGEERGGCMIHNSNYDFNDDILPVGTSFWVRLAESFLPASR